jgi:hypothetical protein
MPYSLDIEEKHYMQRDNPPWAMKFAHMADCHIGGWRDEKMQAAATRSFIRAVDISLEENVDFVLIAGDLFHTSLPGIGKLKTVTEQLVRLRDKGKRVYVVPGSHDFSPSGRTMLDVLHTAGLLHNVFQGEIVKDKLWLRFSEDKSGAKIAGMLGRKGMLEKSYYEDLETEHLEREEGFKIFMFHTALTELKPKDLEKMDSAPVSLLPKGFDYYAGGHVHIRAQAAEPGYQNIVYPGPTFPNSFPELEKLGAGSMAIYDNGTITEKKIELYPVKPVTLDLEGRSAEEAEAMLKEAAAQEHDDAIVTLRLSGTLASGKPTDIDMKGVFSMFYDNGAYFVLKNSKKLLSKEFEEVKVSQDSVDEIEESLIQEHVGQIDIRLGPQEEKELTAQLISVLNTEKQEGETQATFEKRLEREAGTVLKGLF